MTVQILVGDVRERLAELPSASVHCVVTSPPYWGLRAYGGGAAMIGLEPTFDAHIENLVAVFDEVKRVLRPDGTAWLNYGDAYVAGQGLEANGSPRLPKVPTTQHMGDGGGPPWKQQRTGQKIRPTRSNHQGWKPKDLMMMPARVAIALQSAGWWLRSEIIWHKPNPVPESCTDRPTSAHEKLFLLTRSARYFYDAEAVRTPPAEETKALSFETMDYKRRDKYRGHERTHEGFRDKWDGMTKAEQQSSGANLRNVWTIATAPYSDAHFATFPPALVEPCIKAGTSEHGVCGECGAPWKRMVEKSFTGKIRERSGAGLGTERRRETQGLAPVDGQFQEGATYTTTGWRAICECDAKAVSAICLDPFAGAGTVGLVADRLQRDAILIEINPEYAAMAERRIHSDAGMFGEVEVSA